VAALFGGDCRVNTKLLQADDTVCASVKIEIHQELTLERQGFEARLQVHNTRESTPLEDVQVDVE